MSLFFRYLVIPVIVGGASGVGFSVYNYMQERTVLYVLKQDNPKLVAIHLLDSEEKAKLNWESKVRNYKRSSSSDKIGNLDLGSISPGEEVEIKPEEINSLKKECVTLSEVKVSSENFEDSKDLFKRWCIVR